MTYNHLLIIALCFLVPPSLSSQNRMIWDGELPTDNCQTEWGRRTDSIAHGGTHCFQAYPDPWHGPGIRLHCTPSWRVNLSGFDELRFWVKSNMNTPRALNLGIYGWPNVSRSVDITPYLVGGGAIGTEWKEARVSADRRRSQSCSLCLGSCA